MTALSQDQVLALVVMSVIGSAAVAGAAWWLVRFVRRHLRYRRFYRDHRGHL